APSVRMRGSAPGGPFMPVPTAPEVAFLEAIRAHPEDDDPRLVYADWLEEQGDPRGDFIRAHCYFQHLVGWRCHPDAPERRQHRRAPCPTVEAGLGRVPEKMLVALERGARVASMPLPHFLRADEPPPQLLAWLVSLDLAGRDPSASVDTLSDLLARHPWRAGLPPVRLDLSGGRAGHPGLAGIAELPWLTSLVLTGHPGVSDARLKLLAGRRELTRLVLSRTALTDAGLEHLAGLTGLRLLDLAETAVTDAGLTRLTGLGNLRRLDLTET